MSKIVVVGSSLDIGSTLALVLGFAGHCCEIAVGFEEAADLLRKETFDLVLAGYREDISSAESERCLELVSMKTPVVFLSRTAETFEGVSDGTFVGPADPQTLIAFIQSLLRERLETPRQRWPQRQFVGSLPVSKRPPRSRMGQIAT